ncbi:hypothetical protein LPJ56_003283 [Coemansia sp. RSA 2599]|nr:hypothetical protein LPJ75_003039 [Coemansia sp. RSA 2598]KAJ1821223.1 hypothetical protein LPJ56_003283 [Coemansia sp. RSA 2599]
MPSFTLRYFPIYARAEPIKAILSYANADWQLVSPQWPQEKSSQPSGRMPVLEETTADGSKFIISESLAIEEYLANMFDLAVSDNPQKVARQKELRSQLKDVWDLAIQYKFGTPESRPATKNKYDVVARSVIEFHEDHLDKNGSNGHYFSSRITYLDLAVYATITAMTKYITPDFPEAIDYFSKQNAPLINKVLEKVSENPRMTSYVQSTL